jgi:hypothetical protein
MGPWVGGLGATCATSRAHNAYSAKPFVWTRSAESIIEAVNQAKAELQHAD